MGELLIRRREMIPSSTPASPPLNWNYTDGLPDDNGFTKIITGTASETLETSHLLVASPNSSSSIKFFAGDSSVNGRDLSYSSLEVKFRNYQANSCFYFVLYKNDNSYIATRVQYSSNYRGIYLCTASGISGMTKLATINVTDEYTIKLEISGGVGSVYLNGTLIGGNISLPTYSGWTGNYVSFLSSSSSVSSNSYLFSIKYS